MKKSILFASTIVLLSSACVSKKKYKEQLTLYKKLQDSTEVVIYRLDQCLANQSDNVKKIQQLEAEVAQLKASSNALLNQMSDLSVITKAQAESIKASIANISSKDAYIKDLQSAMARKDSLNMALVLKLKGALADINDQDVEIKVEGSAVFISVSDKLLFKSGSYDITPQAKVVLEKVATVLKSQPEIQFMVEGHTDSKPISTKFIKDNWDLSVLRATSVVRMLQIDFGLDPKRMIAAGKSEYVPVTTNDTEEGRAVNRRTKIVILPQLDQFFKLLEPQK
ncbi:MAG: OmpA family protein [Bacteroidetes bacterium]|nr:OmpA family protein [Bacteroidota bacterium]